MVSLNRDALSDKVLEGARISSDEALRLYQLPLEELGALANVRRNIPDAAAESDYRIQKSRAWIDSRRRGRNSGRSSPQENFAVKNQHRSMAGSDAGRARARFEIERDHDVRSCRNGGGANRTFA